MEAKKKPITKVRVRVSPSPTGFLHIGTARTALFNYLFAKQQKGDFILRIEDTDLERSEQKYEEDIIENLKWLGLEWNEGPDVGGAFGPYRQSERKKLYRKYLEQLLKEDKAYYCFCSEEELEDQRQYAMSQGQPWIYSSKCRDLSKEEAEKWLKEGKEAVIRLKTPMKKVEFHDLIRGKVEFDSSLIGDIVVAKSLDVCLYNFANAVDDYEMEITHVIRGEDHISNTPKQILLQEALGFKSPQYSHLPIILGSDRTKLSKRHGSVSIEDFKKEGYLSEALVNFMAFLGWNPGNEREIFSLHSLEKEFSLERVQKGGAVSNLKKLDFINGFYIRQKSKEKLAELCLPYLIEAGLITPFFETNDYPASMGAMVVNQRYTIDETGEKIVLDFIKSIVALYQERLKKLSEIVELTDFFFKDILEYDKQLLFWKEMGETELRFSLDTSENIFSEIKDKEWQKEKMEKIILEKAEEFSQKIQKAGDRGYLLWPLRVALTGKKFSAGPIDIAEILGREKTLKRIKKAKEII